MSGVGIFTIGALVLVLLGAPSDWASGRSDAQVMATAIGLYALASAPFDWLGGYFLPRAYQLRSEHAATFAGRWLRGVLVQSLVLGCCLTITLYAGRAGGLPGAASAFAVCMIALVALQGPLARAVSHQPSETSERTQDAFGLAVRPHRATDPGFTGGIAGLPGMETVVIPQQWREHLAADDMQVYLARKRLTLSGRSRLFGLLVAGGWNLTGFVVITMLTPGAGVDNAGGLMTTALGLGVWSFLGLLILPTPSRRAVMAIDRRTANEDLVESEAVTSAIRHLHHLQHDEVRRGRWIETIFHPIPALEPRIESLTAGDGDLPTGPWNCARMALFLSWACFGMLSRAVHCNVGLPDMWVLLPSD